MGTVENSYCERFSHRVISMDVFDLYRGIVDEHGVQPLGHWVTDRVIYCVVRAPSQEAVCRHHAERGLPCDELRPVTGLRGSHPLGAKEAQIVRAVLNRWPIYDAAV